MSGSGKQRERIIFFGTSEICLPFLETLVIEFDLALIITQPDRRGGRKNQLIKPAVKTFAASNKIDYIQPETLDDSVRQKIANISPLIGIVIAYGQLIPKSIFQIPEWNCINVHFSKLPAYRGAAPVQRAIEAGDRQSAISIFEISRRMDAGKIWHIEPFEMEPDDRTPDVWQKMASAGAPVLIQTIRNIIEGRIEKIRQNHDEASFAAPIKKAEGKLDWNREARQIFNKYRAFFPWPGIFFRMAGKQFKVLELEPTELRHDKAVGQVLTLDRDGLYVSCGNHSVLKITLIQPEGKKAMTPYAYSVGNKIILE